MSALLRRVALISAAAAVGCNGGAGTAGAGSPPAPAPVTGVAPASVRGPAPLRYSPGVTRYLIVQRHHIDNTLPTGNQVQEIGLNTYITTVITGPADARGYAFSLTIDSILADSTTLLPPNIDLQAARGLRYDAHLSPSGQLINAQPSDPAVAKTLSQLLGGFRTFYPRLPAAGITPGSAWADSSEITDTTGSGILRDRSVTRYVTGDWESPSGVRQLGIQLAEDFTVSGSGQAQGTTFALSGTGIRAGRLLVSAVGRFLGGTTTDSAGMVITFDPQGMAIPRHQVSHTTITVLP